MIKKLKLKFILTNIILISIVLISAFSIIYVISAAELQKDSINAMHDIANRKQKLDFFFTPPKNHNKYSYLSTYIIDIDTQNNTCVIDGFGDVDTLNDDQLKYVNSLINAVRNIDKPEGILEQYNVRYYYVNTPRGIRIVFLDKGYEDQNLRELLISFSILGIIIFIGSLIVSIIISNIAVKPVEKSIKQQKQLISDMSHELKTPITIISTNTDIILSHLNSTIAEEQKWIGYIKEETKHMSELTNTMLYLAKTDEFFKQPTLKDLNLSNIAYEIALPFESVCFENKKAFDIDISEDVFIKGDETAIKQLITILLDNAIKYSDNNGRIAFSLQKSRNKATIEVINTGEPIPKESIPFLFDRFYRIDKSRSKQNDGNGLGLSIAKRIVEQNHGSISVFSNAIDGTKFTCSFSLLKNKK